MKKLPLKLMHHWDGNWKPELGTSDGELENRNWELGTRKRELEISTNKEKENGLFSSIL